MAVRLLLGGALGLGLGRAADEPAFLDFEPARLEGGLPEVEGDFRDALDGRDLLLVAVVRARVGGSAGSRCLGVLDLGGDPGWVVGWRGRGRRERCICGSRSVRQHSNETNGIALLAPSGSSLGGGRGFDTRYASSSNRPPNFSESQNQSSHTIRMLASPIWLNLFA